VVKVKICGIRRVLEGQAALEAGADFLGFIFYPPSHRNLAPEEARDLLAGIRASTTRTDWAAVGVFVNEPVAWVNQVAAECGLDYVQLHGTESAAYCARMQRPVIKAMRLPELQAGASSAADLRVARLLLDAQGPGHRGGMGERFDWQAARPYASEALVAGGLTPDNVQEALDVLQPWGLDVSSGVERERFKAPDLVCAFLERVRRWEYQSNGH
jgi:phosphoribosylanthranilate isomerase